jgi:hypothetical protein
VELQLIEVRKIKMLLIQFVSALSLIQMKLMKASGHAKGSELETIEESKLDVQPHAGGK